MFCSGRGVLTVQDMDNHSFVMDRSLPSEVYTHRNTQSSRRDGAIKKVCLERLRDPGDTQLYHHV